MSVGEWPFWKSAFGAIICAFIKNNKSTTVFVEPIFPVDGRFSESFTVWKISSCVSSPKSQHASSKRTWIWWFQKIAKIIFGSIRLLPGPIYLARQDISKLWCFRLMLSSTSWSDLTLQGYTVNLGRYPHFGYCGTRCITVLKLILSHRKHSGITRIVDCYWTEIHPTALSSSKVEIIMPIKRSARSEKKPQFSFCSHLSATRPILELDDPTILRQLKGALIECRHSRTVGGSTNSGQLEGW